MKYSNIKKALFCSRPNRFVAFVDIDGSVEKVHVKNTGRCKELLTEGATVYLEKGNTPGRSTAYDLVAVEKGKRIINMDSQAPNRVVKEYLEKGEWIKDITQIKPETTYGESRLDFYVEAGDRKIFIEVKGVTLEEEGVVRFPDAPSERAVKHLYELKRAVEEGYEAYVFFVIQMQGVEYFTPNSDTHKAFADALSEVHKAGVKVVAYDCFVTWEELSICSPVEVRLGVRALWKDAINKRLLPWYKQVRRDLPWREEISPYRVWVSEIMLQQTRVEAVKPYFKRFMENIPDIASLAMVEEDRLLKLWEGLGYYSRVRNMQKAAIQILENYEGRMPADYENLQKLCGIGSYTAGAIASIAFGQRVPAVDGNVIRVMSRLCMLDTPLQDAKSKKDIEGMLKEVMSAEEPGDFNQAMMELGATVCVPNGRPKCSECPLKDICLANEKECQLEYPKKLEKKERKIEFKTILIIRDAENVAIRKRENKGLLAGMYEFPSMDGYFDEEEVLDYCKKIGLNPLQIHSLNQSKHIFTHKEWHMRGYMIRVDELAPRKEQAATKNWLYVEPGKVEEEYSIPSAYIAYTKYLNIRIGNESF